MVLLLTLIGALNALDTNMDSGTEIQSASVKSVNSTVKPRQLDDTYG